MTLCCFLPRFSQYLRRRLSWFLSWIVVLFLLMNVGVVSPVSADEATAAATTSTGSTVGTASTVSPSTVAVGGAVMYTLAGFPAGASVDVLVDDGTLAPEGDSGVVQSIAVGTDGTASGTVSLPDYVTEGDHWLRFRVNTVLSSGVPEYTNKSPLFTVADVTVIGGSYGAASGVATAAVSSAASMASPEGRDAASASTAEEAQQTGFPVVGASVLTVAVALGMTGLWMLQHRRRLQK